MDTDTTSDQRDNNRIHPSREEVDGSWVVARLLHNDVEGAHADTGNILDDDAYDVDEASNIDASVDLCIELASGDMIDTNKFLTIDIDPFLVIDSYADHNS
jgi:hypothetical protein